MVGSHSIKQRFFISYGAMNAVFPYLGQKKVLQLQALNKFMYHRGVERLQLRIKIPNRFCYFHSFWHRQKYEIFRYDISAKRAARALDLKHVFCS